jgi:plasmid stabilization system protein ParE
MTGRYVLSPCAQTDLGDIWDYTADRWGLAEGIDIVRILHERMDFARHIP